MAIEVERLIATLEARLDKFEKALAKQAGGADKQFKRIEQSGTRMEARLAKLGVAGFKGIAAGAVASVASVLSLQAAIEGAKRALEQFGSIADNARASGLDPETFQELAYQAQQGGVEFEQFSGALETFAKNAGLAVVGKGKMVTALKALNPELLANIQAATTQEERVRLAADAISDAGNASERAALSTALFGDAGSKLAGVFQGGADAIDRTAKEARKLGIVVSNELIGRADELGDQFDTATKVLDLQFKQALIELAPFLIGTVQLVANLTAAVRGLIEAFSAMETKSTSALEGRAAVIKELLASQGTDITTPSGQIVPANAMAMSIGGGDSAALAQELSQIEAILSTRKAIEAIAAPPADTAPTYTAADVESRESAAKAAIKQAEAVKKLTADLELERQSMFLTAEQQAALNMVNSAGIDVNSRQGKELVALAVANEQLRDSMQAVNDLAQSAVSSFVNDLRQGKSAADALSSALGKIADKLIDMALNSAITSLVSTLFGGGFVKPVTGIGIGRPLANGGTVSPGSIHPVGERGPELFVPSSAGRIIPNNRLGGGGATTNLTFNIDAKGAEIGVEQKIVRAIQAMVPDMIRTQAPAATARAQMNRSL